MEDRLSYIDELLFEVIIPDKEVEELQYQVWKKNVSLKTRVEDHMRKIKEAEQRKELQRKEALYNRLASEEKQSRE